MNPNPYHTVDLNLDSGRIVLIQLLKLSGSDSVQGETGVLTSSGWKISSPAEKEVPSIPEKILRGVEEVVRRSLPKVTACYGTITGIMTMDNRRLLAIAFTSDGRLPLSRSKELLKELRQAILS